MGLKAFLLGKRGEEKSTVVKTPDEDPRDDTGREEEKEVQMTRVQTVKQKYKNHTVHLAEVEFTDGKTETFMFDAMKRKGGFIVLYNYTSFNGGRRAKEAFVTIPPHNLKTFKTVRRERVNVKAGEKVYDHGWYTREEAENQAKHYRESESTVEVSLYDK